MRLQTKYKNETGRSMVEMLGVLAVIGVLSVGGISGYSYATRRYRIAQSIQQVNLAMQAARGLKLKKIDQGDLSCSDDSNKPCCIPIHYVMTGLQSCSSVLDDGGTLGEKYGFLTPIGACVSVCRDNRNIWYLSMGFDPNRENKRDIITPSDCRNMIASNIGQDGFFDNNNDVKNRTDTDSIEEVCSLFVETENAD